MLFCHKTQLATQLFCLLTGILLVSLTGAAQNISFVPASWKTGIAKPASAKGGAINISAGKASIATPDLELRKYDIQMTTLLNLEMNGKYQLHFKAQVNKTGSIEVAYTTEKPPYQSYFRTWIKLEPGKTDYSITINITKKPKQPWESGRACVLRLYFGTNRNWQATLSNIKLSQSAVAKLAKHWQVFAGADADYPKTKVPTLLKATSGKTVSPVNAQLNQNTIDIAKVSGKPVSEGNAAILYNEFTASESGTMLIGTAADWWEEINVNGKTIFSTMGKGNGSGNFSPNDHIIEFPYKAGTNIIAVKVLSGSGGWKFVWGKPVPKQAEPTIQFSADKNWKPFDLKDKVVKAGSALDLSGIVDAPAGKHGRVVIGPGGSLAFANAPDKPVRLRGFNGVPRHVWQYYPKSFKSRAKLFAQAARRQGYSLLRMNMFECSICSGAPGDMQFNKTYLDRWDYLLAALKEEGIYAHLVIASYGGYFSPFSFNSEIFKKRNEHKMRMFLGCEAERTHWKFGAEFLMSHVNPYTGIAWKDDPSLAIVEFYNEQQIGMRRIPQFIKSNPEIKSLMETQWRKWLVKEFPNKIPSKLSLELKSKPLAKAPLPDIRLNNSELNNQFQKFLNELERENLQWYIKIIRNAGYPGIITQYNFSKSLGYSAVRWELSQAVESNGYFCHPSNSEVKQYSSIEKQADYWRSINSTRLYGRPFLVTEFNHAFWNRYQHEGGLVFGAYSALQGFDSIMIHSGPVILDPDPRGLGAFSSGDSPVLRAGEFLSGCLYGRGDVKKSPNRLILQIPDKFLNINCNRKSTVNSDQCKLGLISGFALEFPGLPKPSGVPAKMSKPSFILKPAIGSSETGSDWFSLIKDLTDHSFNLDQTVITLKSKGILPESNQTNPSQGIFQSDTGEILMRSKEKLIKVITPKTEAVCLQSGTKEHLKQLTVKNSSVPATIAVSSIDGNPLSNSSRMVLIYSTDTANSGMELSYDRNKLVKKGKLPVLLQTGRFTITINTPRADKLSLYALSFDGSRREKLPVRIEKNKLVITINTASLKNGPTVFFELSAE